MESILVATRLSYCDDVDSIYVDVTGFIVSNNVGDIGGIDLAQRLKQMCIDI